MSWLSSCPHTFSIPIKLLYSFQAKELEHSNECWPNKKKILPLSGFPLIQIWSYMNL